MEGWYGVDLDGTLAKYDGWKGVDHIGEPILPMLNRVIAWVHAGRTVKIFTARVGNGASSILPIKAWCKEHIGVELEVTNVKDFAMIELWDDRCVTVEANTGSIITAWNNRTDGWIPVSDISKPEPCKVVLFKTENAKYPIVGYYSKTYGLFESMSGGRYPVGIVTHYHELP